MKKLTLAILISISTGSYGQSQTSDDPRIQKPFIEVTGTASKEIIPDRIFISIILSEKVVNNVIYTIQAQENKLKDALSKNNINAADLSLSDASSEITRIKQKETGVKLTKAFTLLVKNSDEVSKVFKELHAINVREASVLRTEHSRIDSLRKEVRIAAIKAAKEKAEYLLRAIGEQIDKPLEIREQDDGLEYLSNVASNYLSLHTRPVETVDGENETDFEKLTIKFSYFIRYSIK